MSEYLQKSESPAATGQIADQTNRDQIVALAQKIGNTDKQLATLKAQFALRGFAVQEVATGGYFVTRWNLSKFCPALPDLESFAAQVGAA